jgi:hypothetical protein
MHALPWQTHDLAMLRTNHTKQIMSALFNNSRFLVFVPYRTGISMQAYIAE